MKKQVSISLYRRRWSSVSLLYVVEQMRENNYRSSAIKESLVLRRRSDYFYIEQPPGNQHIFIPDSLFRESWNVLCVLLVLYQNFAVMYLLSYTSQTAHVHFILLVIIDFLFIAEIILNFNTGYFANGVLVKYRYKIFKTYLRSRFFFDILACVPFGLFIPGMGFDLQPKYELTQAEYLKLLWVLKLLNNNKLLKVLHGFQSRISSELLYTVFHMIKFVVFALVLTHWMTCLMYYFFVVDFYNTGMIWDQIYNSGVDPYLKYFYLIVSTATSTGYGDIVPYSISQKVLCICIMGFLCWLFAFILTNIKEIFLKYTSVHDYFKETLLHFKKFAKDKALSRGLRQRSIAYLKYLKENSEKKIYAEDKILEIISGPLKEEVFIVTRGNILHKCPVFMHFSQDFLRYLMRFFEHSVYAPRDLIFHEEDRPESMYFIINGRVEIYHERTQTSFKELNKKRFFGEIGFFLGSLRTASARALIFTEMLSLSRHRMEKILETKRGDQETHKIFILQSKENLNFLGIKCYLCLRSGHVAKDCKKFVIVVDHKKIAKKADNKKYDLNKKISGVGLVEDEKCVKLEFYRKEWSKGMKRGFVKRFEDSRVLAYKCQCYLNEGKKNNYKENVRKVCFYESDSESSINRKKLVYNKDSFGEKQMSEKNLQLIETYCEVQDVKDEYKTVTFRAPCIKISQLE